MMPTLRAPIVGMHFRPPAKAIIAVLVEGAPLRLVPEPENPYDENAVRVEVSKDVIGHALETSGEANLAMLLEGFGMGIDEVIGPDASESWHLGYIESSKTGSAARFAAALEGRSAEAKMGFDMTGKPTAILEM